MATQTGPGLSGVNWQAWQTWPSFDYQGRKLYSIPGAQGYVYNPYIGEQGVYGPDPRAAEQAAKDAQPSTWGPIAATVGGAAATGGGIYLANKASQAGSNAGIIGSAPVATPTPAAISAGAPQPTTSAGLLSLPQNSAGAVPATPQVVSGTRVALPPGATTGPNGETIQPDGTAVSADGFPVGRVVQGAGGAFLLYNGIQRFRDGDKLGGGLQAGYGATLAASSAGSTLAADAVPVAGAIYGTYELGNMGLHGGDYHTSDTGSLALKGAAGGAAIGTAIAPGVGTAIGAGLGALYGTTIGLTSSHKGEYQQIRDQWRSNVIKSGSGLITPDYKGTLADGTVIDWNKNDSTQGKGTKNMHFDDPVVAKAVAYGNSLATAQGAVGKAREAIAGELAKAAIANANGDTEVMKANMRHFAEQIGLTPETAQARITETQQTNYGDKIGEKDAQDFQVYHLGIQDLYGTNTTTQPLIRRQSNGKYRISPGVYSDKAPTTPVMQPVAPAPISQPVPLKTGTVFSGKPLPLSNLTPIPRGGLTVKNMPSGVRK